MRNFAKVCIYA
jgi:hypothetical protein